MVALVALASTLQNYRGSAVLEAYRKTVAPYTQAEFVMTSETPEGVIQAAEVRVIRSPEAYWCRMRRGSEVLSANRLGELITYTNDDGAIQNFRHKDYRVIKNDACVSGLYGWDVFFDPKRLNAPPGNVFYVDTEEIEGRKCDEIGVVKRGSDVRTIRFFWIDQESHLPVATQYYYNSRGNSRMFPRELISDVVLKRTADIARLEKVDAGIPAKPVADKAPDLRTIPAGSALPKVELQTMDLQTITLTFTKSHRTYVAFWAPWCGPCKRELAALQELKIKDLDVVTIGGFDSKENIRKSQRLLPKDARNLIDPDCERKTSRVAEAFGIDGEIPHGFLFDENGRLIKDLLGFNDKERLRTELEK